MTGLILLSPLIPLTAALILLSGSLLGLRANGRTLAVLAVLAGTVWCLYSEVIPHPMGGASSGAVDQGTLSPGLGLLARLPAERLSFIWLLGVHWLALLLFLWPHEEDRGAESLRHESFAGLLLLAVAQGVILSVDAWTQWVLMSMAGWAFAMLATTFSPDLTDRQETTLPTGEQNRGSAGSPSRPDPLNAARPLRAARRTLVTLTVADLAWLMGLVPLFQAFGTLQVSDLTHAAGPGGMAPFQTSAVIGSGFWLLCSLMIRCGLFPLMGWMGEMAHSPRAVAWLIAFPLGLGMFLLIRWHPLLFTTESQRTLIAGLAGLSTLLLAGMAFGRKPPAHKLVRATGALLALAWLGLAAMPPSNGMIAAFSLSVLFLSVWLSLELTRPANAQVPEKLAFHSPAWNGVVEDGNAGMHSAPVLRYRRRCLIGVGLLCSGLLGQEQIFDAVRDAVRLSDGRFPAALLAVVLIAHGLICSIVFRILLGNPLTRHETGSMTTDVGENVAGKSDAGFPEKMTCSSPVIPFALTTLTYLLAGLTLLIPWFLAPSQEFRVSLPGATAILGLMALVAAWYWPAGETTDPGTDAVMRLSQEEFYSQRMIDGALLRLVEAIAVFVRLVDRIALDRLTLSLARDYWKRLGETADAAAEESSAPHAALTLLFTAAVLVTALLLAS